MRAVLSIAGKELRALFQSQVAVLFLALFLVATNITFFVVSRFFARNIADLTPLFSWLPLNVIVLVSAVAMRAWAEEQKSGTLEILLTLPVKTRELVLGKFVAGMSLVALALGATIMLPITVSMVGPLDWGPVIGGYLGGLLLASAYLSIGLCVSARTDNQVVALMGTVAIGGLLYAIGTDTVQSLLGATNGQIASLLGTGSRFSSIARGVVDLRDVVYYGSLTTFFLVLNGYFLDRRRIDAQGDGAQRLLALRGLVALVAVNAVLANVWLHPVRVARVDLTENQDYTISDVTASLLADLDEPLLIQGVFSERSHPKLQPLAPQVAALLEEYAIVGGDDVIAELLDPSSDDDLALLLEQEYGIRPIPMPAADRNETRIVNSWFHVLLRYGDQHTVVTFNELIEAEQDPSSGDLRVRLKDPEYDLTKAIRRVTQDFATTESLVAELPAGSTLRLFATEGSLDPMMRSNLDVMREVGQDLAKLGDNLSFEEVDPAADPQLAEEIATKYGVQPTLSFATGQIYWLHLVLDTGDKAQRVFPRGELTKKDLEGTLDSALQRAVPGQLKTVAVYTETPAPPPSPPGRTPEPALPPDYRIYEQLLSQRFEVKPSVDLTEGRVPDDVDVLVIGKAGALSAQQQLAIDTFLMRGGAVIALAGRKRVELERGRFVAKPEDASLFDMLEHYGVTVPDELVLDTQSGTLALPGGRGRPVQFPYPYWLDLRQDQFAEGHLALSGVPYLSAPWVSPVELQDVPEGLTGEVLLTASPTSWTREDPDLMPDFNSYSRTGFQPPTTQGSRPIAVTVTGRFPSFFDESTRPRVEGALTEPVADGRLVVIGSSEMMGDVILQYAQNPMGRMHANNTVLTQNLVDWALEDTDLLSIRNAGSFDRALDPLTDAATTNFEYANYGFSGLLLAGFFIVARRRRPVPTLPERSE